MSDFFQTGAISTLHRLGQRDLPRMERELMEFSKESPIALVLPCHTRELGSLALEGIVNELKKVTYLRQIVVGIDAATRADWQTARKVFCQLPQNPVLIWNGGPRMNKLMTQLETAELSTGPAGKGRNVWTCFGYVLASEQARIIALHDCDIVNYQRELLARLCYPVAHPSFGFDFCKGYYGRVTDRLNGRVMRLLMTPLLRALRSVVASHPLLDYLDSFRYPLAGEISMHLELASRLRVPFDWSLEVGTLAEVFRNATSRAICQSELCSNYDHAHQELSPEDSRRGLSKMAFDIAKAVFRQMAAEGVRLDSGLFDTLLTSYLRQAEDALRVYAADAAINGLNFPRHEEEAAVAAFKRSIRAAAKAFQEDPTALPLIPNWDRLKAALPRFFDDLLGVIALDNKG